MKTLTVAVLALVAGTAAASAESYAERRIDKRQAIQNHRIEDGRRTGQLTRHEVRDLRHQQSHIRALERRAKADGHIDRREAFRLERAQDRASRRIATERHDHDRRGFWYRRWW